MRTILAGSSTEKNKTITVCLINKQISKVWLTVKTFFNLSWPGYKTNHLRNVEMNKFLIHNIPNIKPS
jgi:hypothetical protein